MLDLKALLTKILTNMKSKTYINVPMSTPTVGTLVTKQCTKCGDVRNLILVVSKSTATAVGANLFSATITDASECPYHVVNGCGYIGSSCCVAQLAGSGNLSIRVTGAQVAANTQVYVSLTYIVQGGN